MLGIVLRFVYPRQCGQFHEPEPEQREQPQPWARVTPRRSSSGRLMKAHCGLVTVDASVTLQRTVEHSVSVGVEPRLGLMTRSEFNVMNSALLRCGYSKPLNQQSLHSQQQSLRGSPASMFDQCGRLSTDSVHHTAVPPPILCSRTTRKMITVAYKHWVFNKEMFHMSTIT